MSDAPERVWAWSFNTWDQWGGYARQDNRHPLDDRERATGAEYIRRDPAVLAALPEVQTQIDAAVKAERERCAQVALSEGKAMERAAQAFMPPHTHADDALYHMHVGGAQTAERIAAPYPQGGTAMTIVRVPGWGLSITEARYYGYRWGAHVGPWLVFFGQAEGRG